MILLALANESKGALMFSLISIILAILLALYHPGEFLPQPAITGPIIAGMGALMLFLTGLTLSLNYIPLQSAEQNITPRVLELYQKDKFILLAPMGILGFTFLSMFLAFNQEYFNFIKPFQSILIWTVGFGISLDLFGLIWRRTLYFINPFKTVSLFVHRAKKSIQDNKEVELCDTIDAISEIGIKSAINNNTALCIEALSELRHTMRVFLESFKTIGHEVQDPDLKKIGVRDTVSFVIFYALQRFEMIFDLALEKKIEPICSTIITALGKITVFAAKYDITMTNYPLHFLNKLALKALGKNLSEVGVKSSLVILDTAKTIVNEMDVAYMELQPPFLSMINTLDAIAKETFKQDKKINIKILLQPFYDLKELMQSDKIATQQDTPVILSEIVRVIGEFETLETVLKTIPPLPNLTAQEG